jgi:hypothetical protein
MFDSTIITSDEGLWDLMPYEITGHALITMVL